MAKTVADHFTDILATAGLPRIWSSVGDRLDGLADAIRMPGWIEWVHGAPPALQ
jgi:hypothetical protein